MSDSLDLSSADPLQEEILDRLEQELTVDRGEEKKVIVGRYCMLYPEHAESIRAAAAGRAALGLLFESPESFDGGHTDPSKARSLPKQFGPYRVIRELARGGMGIVYEAEDGMLPRRVAVKTIKRDSENGRDLLNRFERERAVLARLHHTHIVPIFASGQEEDLLYFAMPSIHGASLRDVIKTADWHSSHSSGSGLRTSTVEQLVEEARTRFGSTLASGSPAAEPVDRATPEPNEDSSSASSPKNVTSTLYLRSAVEIIASVARALHQAHQAGIIHRDLKPSNLMVEPTGHPWVLDFGLAWITKERNGETNGVAAPPHTDANPAPKTPRETTNGVHTEGIIGTPQYMAPEQFGDDGGRDPRTDVWGLGVTLYELLTLSKAFSLGDEVQDSDMVKVRDKVLNTEPIPPRNLVSNLTRDLEAVCMKALAKKPEARYQTAQELADDLRRWLKREPVKARPVTVVGQAWYWSCRNKLLATTISLVSLCVVTMTILLLQFFNVRAARASAEAGLAKAEATRATAEAETTKVQLAAAEELGQAQRREVISQKLDRLRLMPHTDRWSAEAWDLVRRAAEIRRDRTLQGQAAATLRGQAAATLIGLDVRVSKHFDFGAYSVALDPEGKRLLMGRVTDPKNPKTISGARIWDFATEQLTELGVAKEGPVGFRADGAPVQLVREASEKEETLALWDLAKQQVVTRFTIPGKLAIRLLPEIAMMPDGSMVAAPVELTDGKVALAVWDGVTGKLLHRFVARTSGLSFSPDGTLLAGGGDDGRIFIWSLRTGEEVAILPAGHTIIHCLAFGRDQHRGSADARERPGQGWLLAAGAAGGEVTIWDLGTKILRAFCHGAHYDTYAVAFSPDGATLASIGFRGIKFWDVASGRALLERYAGLSAHGLVFSGDGHHLVMSDEAQVVEILDLEEGRGIRPLRGLLGQIAKVIFSPDGRLVASLSHEWQIGVWDARNGHLKRVLDVPQGMYADNAALAFSPDGRRLAFSTGGNVSSEGIARLWDLDSGRELNSWTLPRAIGDTLVFHPSGKLLLCRVEIKDGKEGPFGNVNPRDHPRVCRIRDLLGPNPMTALAEIADYDWQVHYIVASPGGDYFVLDGLNSSKGLSRSVTAFDGPTGKKKWSMPSPRHRDAAGRLLVDPSGKVLAILAAKTTGESSGILVEIATGKVLRLFDKCPICLGPGAKTWAMSDQPYFWCSLGQAENDHLVDLGIDTQFSGVLFSFSPDGRNYAWGDTEGTVFIADIPEVQRRLAEFGLGW